MGIILPDSLITGKEFFLFRKALISEHNLKGIIELPERIFARTEALTHILIIEKNKASPYKSMLLKANKNGQIIDEIEVDKDELLERMDFKFHYWRKKTKRSKIATTLGDIAEIKRGTFSHKELKEQAVSYLHTTCLKHKSDKLCIKSFVHPNSSSVHTQTGDIILARVGRGCVGKISLIMRGKVPISDCLYRIRVPKLYLKKVWNALCSTEGQNWFRANSHGVCAKVVSKKDLLNFPISLAPQQILYNLFDSC